MVDLQLHNTLTGRLEVFKSQQPAQVGLYTCGPTVYNYAHLGNLRAYLFADLLKRTLLYNGYQVKHVMNITDVGHLTDDADTGEDKMETSAQRENKTAWQIAEFYIQAFQTDLQLLNIIPPTIYCRATDYIEEQIELAKTLDQKGYLYTITDGVYFDTSQVDNYNQLSHLPLDQLQEGARVDKNPEKRQATDFAVWKFTAPGIHRQMEWDSPWGRGFPGWHLECSAMSLKLLDGMLDIHCGGIDHINVHHTNEIAQAEAATGQPFFRFWLHNAFLNIAGGKKMAKSDNNFLTTQEALIKPGLLPLAYRYAAWQVHYRKPMEYSPASLVAADQALRGLYRQIASLGSVIGQINQPWQDRFKSAINQDLNSAQALAVVYELLKSDLSPADQLAMIIDFDQVLGLQLTDNSVMGLDITQLPSAIQVLFNQRLQARQSGDYQLADQLRQELLAHGYQVEDTANSSRLISSHG